eukprot:3318160-Rhodomonas_salina.3
MVTVNFCIFADLIRARKLSANLQSCRAVHRRLAVKGSRSICAVFATRRRNHTFRLTCWKSPHFAELPSRSAILFSNAGGAREPPRASLLHVKTCPQKGSRLPPSRTEMEPGLKRGPGTRSLRSRPHWAKPVRLGPPAIR